jgi:hypothetical protein
LPCFVITNHNNITLKNLPWFVPPGDDRRNDDIASMFAGGRGAGGKLTEALEASNSEFEESETRELTPAQARQSSEDHVLIVLISMRIQALMSS